MTQLSIEAGPFSKGTGGAFRNRRSPIRSRGIGRNGRPFPAKAPTVFRRDLRATHGERTTLWILPKDPSRNQAAGLIKARDLQQDPRPLISSRLSSTVPHQPVLKPVRGSTTSRPGALAGDIFLSSNPFRCRSLVIWLAPPCYLCVLFKCAADGMTRRAAREHPNDDAQLTVCNPILR